MGPGKQRARGLKPRLLCAAFEALGEHRDLVYGFGVVTNALWRSEFDAVRTHSSTADHIKRLFLRSRKSNADHIARRRNRAEMSPLCIEYLNAGGAGYV